MKVLKIVLAAVLSLAVLSVAGIEYFKYTVGKSAAEGMVYDNADNDTVTDSIIGMKELGIDVIEYEKTYNAKRFFIDTEDGYKIPVSLLSADGVQNKNTVILLHGETGDRTTTYEAANVFIENGWNVLAVDARNHGLSDFPYITFGLLESRDLKYCVDYVKKTAPDKVIGLHGQSMGAATIGMYLSTTHAKENVSFAVMDSSYDNMTSMLIWGMEQQGINAPIEFTSSCCNSYLKKHYGFSLDDVDIVKSMETNYVPTLIIQGKKDDLVLPRMGEAIYNAIPSENKKSELWKIDCGHVEGVHVMFDEYKEKVLSFAQNAMQNEEWEIYESEKFGYSIRYPKDRFTVQNSEGYDCFSYSVNDDLSDSFFSISVVPKEYAHTVQESFTDLAEGEFKNCVIGEDKLDAKVGEQTETRDGEYVSVKKYYAHLAGGGIMIIETRSHSEACDGDFEKMLATIQN